MDYRIGCSGYYYSSWKGKFYPKEILPKNWLTYYSSIFNTVELNGTFYRMPQVAALKRYAAATPDEFTFSVKASKYITHILRLKEAKKSVSEFQAVIREGLQEKFSKLLFQLPPSFSYSEENLARVIDAVPHSPDNIVEFRNITWWNEHVLTALRASNITFCNVDYPGLASTTAHTTSTFYLRLHGNPVLFKSSYEKSDLESFVSLIPAETTERHIYLNNTYFEAGYTNALELMEIIKTLKQ